jgi:hypothetical protein
MKVKRVVLEPELEAIAGHLSAYDRIFMAAILERWARQLEVSANLHDQAKPRSLRKRGRRN